MIKIRNIGIFAHVDAGKTTLTERLLSHAGAIRTAGSVDAGTAHTDTLPVERRRGISVKATCVGFSYGDTRINLIDTPGHADFSAEIERSLWALDAAVLVVCSAEGVQPQTEVLFSALREQNIPVIFFLNKTDRVGADVDAVLRQIHRELTPKAVPPADTDALTELVCDADENMLERYMSGDSISPSLLRSKLAELAARGDAYPVLWGSALRDEGVSELLNAIVEFMPEPANLGSLSGVVFAAQQNRTLGRGVWIRLYGGSLENRSTVVLPMGIDPITGENRVQSVKITQIQDPSGTSVGHLSAGQIGIVYGLGSIPIGHVLGSRDLIPRSVNPGGLRTPLIAVQAVPSAPDQMQALRQACQTLSDEDPLLQATYIRHLNELHLQVMGTIQLEVLGEILKNRFDLDVSFSPPAIIYRETVTQPCEGFVAYTMPKPCWAILKFRIEPAPRGSGVIFQSQVPVRQIQARHQHQVEQAIPLALSQGRLGWQVTDVKITLIDGGDHQFHTHPLDFIVATPMAIQDGLRNGGSTLLEPILDVRFHVPGENVGRVISDVSTMRGEVLDTLDHGERVILNARIPVQTSLDYAATLASFTRGKGSMSIRLHGYRECPLELGATTRRRNVDPLDTSKYILAARSALEGGIFDI